MRSGFATAVVRLIKTLGVDLTQKERRLNGVGLGMSVDVGNQLDVRKRKDRMSVGLEMC